MKKQIFTLLLFLISISSTFAQEIIEKVSYNRSFGINVGYDIPTYDFNFTHLDYSNGLHAGVFADFKIYKPLFLGLEYDFFQNSPTSLISNEIAYPLGLSAISTEKINVFRHYIGLSPKLKIPLFKNRLNITLGTSVGVSYVSGGDILISSIDPASGIKDIQLIQAGYKSFGFSHKYYASLEYYITPNLGISVGAYNIYHNSVHSDRNTNFNSVSQVDLIFGVNDFDVVQGQYTVTGRDALVLQVEEYCGLISSIGINAGLTYRLGTKKKVKNVVDEVNSFRNKLIVTVKDGPSSNIIPGADVVVKNEAGQIVTTGTTNSFGVVELEVLPNYEYQIEGMVYGIPTTISQINKDEFSIDPIVRKELFYEDLRFILMGDVVNINTKNLERDVLVSLTNSNTRSVDQSTSDYSGAFEFRLDKNSSYSIVGIKENRLSDVARASTLGLNRSTTLFVDLELGIENFECNRGMVLDIKYEFDKDDILPESRYNLDKLVRYMNAHNVARVELSSHTDSRGPTEYNMNLSQRRAQSAVNYIMSKGVSASRIIAQGYGETRLLNNCGDGANCSESDHRINRRTEAKLICN